MRDSAIGLAVQATYDVLSSTWVISKDERVWKSALLALAAMTCLLPTDQLEARFSKVLKHETLNPKP